jgi:hypothetical protein
MTTDATRPIPIQPGTRVRLVAPTWGLRLTADTGVVVRPDRWGDYYVVRLDAPAEYDHGAGSPELLWEVCELVDNLEVLPEGMPREC